MGVGEHMKGVRTLRRFSQVSSTPGSLDLHKTKNLAFGGEGSNFLALLTMADIAECLPSSHFSTSSMLVPNPPLTQHG